MDTQTSDELPVPLTRKAYLRRGTLIALVSFAVAVGAGFTADALMDEEIKEPKLSAPPLKFTKENKEPSSLGKQPGSDALPDRSFGRLEGGTTSFADYRGSPLVINFFASYCPPCIKEMPAFESVNKELGDQIRIVGVSLRESTEDAQKIVDQTGVTYDIIRDPSGNLASDLGVVVMPSTFFVSADGKIIESVPGEMSADEIRAKIKTISK